MRILAICGSLRRHSTNRALLLAVQKQAPEGTKVAIIAVQGVRSKVDESGTVRDPKLALQVQSALKALEAFV